MWNTLFTQCYSIKITYASLSIFITPLICNIIKSLLYRLWFMKTISEESLLASLGKDKTTWQQLYLLWNTLFTHSVEYHNVLVLKITSLICNIIKSLWYRLLFMKKDSKNVCAILGKDEITDIWCLLYVTRNTLFTHSVEYHYVIV